ncbi:hypothetical protein L195_g038417 [Trifolium pratense]|uniref:Uncharacterized protein n=1 Tax=Trifolium pratense TaxID=57577 RepID=A0A2K3LV25_TRIPR|nr:hypothetical protein L195_g038417 [Trifolium pratense]
MVLQPFSGSHLMVIKAIKGLGPAQGLLYSTLLVESGTNSFTKENLCFTLTDLSVGVPAGHSSDQPSTNYSPPPSPTDPPPPLPPLPIDSTPPQQQPSPLHCHKCSIHYHQNLLSKELFLHQMLHLTHQTPTLHPNHPRLH